MIRRFDSDSSGVDEFIRNYQSPDRCAPPVCVVAQAKLPSNYQAAIPRCINTNISTNMSHDMMAINFRFNETLNQSCVDMEFQPREPFTKTVDVVTTHGDFMKRMIRRHSPTTPKFQLCVHPLFRNTEDDERDWFVSNSAEVVDLNNLDDYLESNAARLDAKIENYSERGSNWRVIKLLKICIRASEYSQLCRFVGHRFIMTPNFIATKKFVINVQNNDDLCFIYSILAILKFNQVPNGRRHKVNKYI